MDSRECGLAMRCVKPYGHQDSHSWVHELRGSVGLDGDTKRDWATDGPALERRIKELEALLAAQGAQEPQVCAKQYHLHVWSRGAYFIGVALAEDVKTARELLLEEIGGSDGSCPERTAAANWVREQGPAIWHRRGAEFALTDSAELRECEDECEKFREQIKQLKATPPVQGAGTPPLEQLHTKVFRLTWEGATSEGFKSGFRYCKDKILDWLKEAIERDAAHQPPVEALRGAEEADLKALAEHITHLIQSLLTTKYTNSFKIAHGIIEQNLLRFSEGRRAIAAQEKPAQPLLQEPWLYAIEEPDGTWNDGEDCLFGDLASAQDELDSLNDDGCCPGYKIVPLYRAEKPAQPSEGGMREQIIEEAKNVVAYFFDTHKGEILKTGPVCETLLGRLSALAQQKECPTCGETGPRNPKVWARTCTDGWHYPAAQEKGGEL